MRQPLRVPLCQYALLPRDRGLIGERGSHVRPWTLPGLLVFDIGHQRGDACASMGAEARVMPIIEGARDRFGTRTRGRHKETGKPRVARASSLNRLCWMPFISLLSNWDQAFALVHEGDEARTPRLKQWHHGHLEPWQDQAREPIGVDDQAYVLEPRLLPFARRPPLLLRKRFLGFFLGRARRWAGTGLRLETHQ